MTPSPDQLWADRAWHRLRMFPGMNTAAGSQPPTPSGVYTVGLVACASQKLQRPAPARDLYVSPLFRKASAYAERTCDRWYVLSAKHALVRPDEVIEPYDLRLGAKASPPIKAWASMVREQLTAELEGVGNVSLVALAGVQYGTALVECPWPYEVPMKGPPWWGESASSSAG